MNYLKQLALALTVSCIGLLFGGMESRVMAQAPLVQWTSATPILNDLGVDPPYTDPRICRDRYHNAYQEKRKINGESGEYFICVSQGGPITLAYSGLKDLGGNSTTSYQKATVGFPNESKLYRVSVNLDPTSPWHTSYIASRDTLITYNAQVFRNVASRLQPPTSGGYDYSLNLSTPDFKYKYSSGSGRTVRTHGVSQNGKWMVFSAAEGVMLVNMDTFSYKRIDNQHPMGSSWYDNRHQLTVSNDGAHVVIAYGPAGHILEIIDVTGNCGDVVTDQTTINTVITNPCPRINLTNVFTPTVTTASNPRFNDSGSEISLLVYQGGWRRAVLTPAGHSVSTKLDYLALGDSFASGEGDVERLLSGRKYYLPHSNVDGNYTQGIPEEKCHISPRSYPFLLRMGLNMTSEKMKSVACSGAMQKDMIGSSEYKGQRLSTGKPRLEGLQNIQELQDKSRNEFIAGRILQADFLEVNSPKAITLTLGGNDIGFDKKLRACITSHVLSNCTIATEKGRADMGKEIKAQYQRLKDLYVNLKTKSPNSKFYVIGYPQFINDTSNSCALNVALSATEREMIVKSVTYLNSIIKAAANDAKLLYVNVEDVFKGQSFLDGHRLCESGEQFVTGVTSTTDQSEMFHPNAKGHNAIYQHIKQGLGSQSLQNFSNCNATIVCPGSWEVGEPATPTFFAEPMSLHQNAVAAYEFISENVQAVATGAVVAVQKGVNWIAQTSPQAVQPTTLMRFELNSTPVDLGTFVSNADGSIGATLNIPSNVPAGFHTLRMYGKTYHGEDIDMYQIIEVQGAPGDIDEDSIVDSNDECLYVTAANVDTDYDAVDDACDTDISNNPEVYRVRNGLIINGEQENDIYFERNTRASNITGISNDYDPDADGWAIVGKSQSGQYAGKLAKFWVDTNNIPHASVRSAENGCVQYSSVDLSRVMPLTARTLSIEQVNTATCRIAQAQDDLDGNGQADNIQDIYRARNGIPANGENADSVYVERNTRTAEANLQISDYADIDQESTDIYDDRRVVWSLLASSQNANTEGVYKKLVMNGVSPVILVEDINNQCIALKPTSLSFIKQSTQLSRGLEQISIPPGVTCSA